MNHSCISFWLFLTQIHFPRQLFLRSREFLQLRFSSFKWIWIPPRMEHLFSCPSTALEVSLQWCWSQLQLLLNYSCTGLNSTCLEILSIKQSCPPSLYWTTFKLSGHRQNAVRSLARMPYEWVLVQFSVPLWSLMRWPFTACHLSWQQDDHWALLPAFHFSSPEYRMLPYPSQNIIQAAWEVQVNHSSGTTSCHQFLF